MEYNKYTLEDKNREDCHFLKEDKCDLLMPNKDTNGNIIEGSQCRNCRFFKTHKQFLIGEQKRLKRLETLPNLMHYYEIYYKPKGITTRQFKKMLKEAYRNEIIRTGR